jgi:hypothetical protein
MAIEWLSLLKSVLVVGGEERLMQWIPAFAGMDGRGIENSPPAKVRPELLCYLLAVEAMVWRERQKLDQCGGPPESPLILPDGTGPYPDREAAEHPYPESF